MPISNDDSMKTPPTSTVRRLLVVDDSPDAALMLSMLLQLMGHDVRVAHDGPSALEMAESFKPMMVFLDIGMPGMDGCEVAVRMRKLPGLESAVLAALTGWGQEEDRERTSQAGFDLHLVKPLDPKVLEGILRELPGDR
jgi:CheY-like chemotaxis protein